MTAERDLTDDLFPSSTADPGRSDSVDCSQCLQLNMEVEAAKSQLLDAERVISDRSCKIDALGTTLDAANARAAHLEHSLQAQPNKEGGSQSTPNFSICTIAHSDELVKLYTGLPGMTMFDALYEFVEDCAPELVMWSGSRSLEFEPTTSKKKQHALTSKNELLVTLMKLRLDCPYVDLSLQFGVSTAGISRIATTWLILLHKNFSCLDIWPCREQLDRAMPPQFKELYPSTRIIIDCTEFAIEKPSDPDSQRATWSSYKHRNTFKLLVGITPSGAISFLSKLYGGSVSDNEITLSSGILDLLEAGDSLMADKGFQLERQCTVRNIELNIPPLLGKDAQLSSADLIKTRRIASLRVHVERVIECVKNFHILDFITSNWYLMADVLVHVCAMLTNFQGPAIV